MKPEESIQAGHGSKQDRLWEKAIVALLTTTKVEDAARSCGVSRSSMLRWLQDSAFQEAFRAARRRVLEAALSSLQEAAGAAVEALRRNLRCRKPSVEVQAGRAILDYAMRSVEMLELEERVRQQEASVNERVGNRR
jgi:hypothetical protein